MLLANRTVAKFIAEAYPDRALLRCHPEPNERKLKELEAFAQEQGIAIDASSSSALHRSLQSLAGSLHHSLTRFFGLLVHSSVDSLVHWSIHSPIHSFIRSTQEAAPLN